MTCKICGKKSGFYPLCRNCNDLKDDGVYTKCESCGSWKDDNKPLCHNCWSNKNNSIRNTPSIRGLSETECEVCGNNSYGKPLCRDCYEKSIEGVLTKCENCGSWKKDSKPLCHDCWVEVASSNDKTKTNYIDQNFREKYKEGLKVRTKHGLYVRSGIERTIADFFYEKKIMFEYEPTLPLDGQEYHPDFYIQEIGVYLEHWGSDEPGYVEKRRKKEEAYRKHNVKFISTEKSDVNNIYDKLKNELSRYGLNIVQEKQNQKEIKKSWSESMVNSILDLIK